MLNGLEKQIGCLTLGSEGSEDSSLKSTSSILTSSSDSIYESDDEEYELKDVLSDSASESSCDSTNSTYGANTLSDKIKDTIDDIDMVFKVNLLSRAQRDIVTRAEIAANPDKYFVFLTKGDRLDYFTDHSKRREYVQKAVEDTVDQDSEAYKSQALIAIEAKPQNKQERLLRVVKRNSAITDENVRFYVSPTGFRNAVARMGNKLGNPWLSTSKSSTLSTTYATAPKYNPKNPPSLHPHYNYTPKKRTLFTALEEGKLQKGWIIYWEDLNGNEYNGFISRINKDKHGATTLKVKLENENKQRVITIEKDNSTIIIDGDLKGKSNRHILVQRPKERGRPKHRLYGIKTVFAIEANEYIAMPKADVEDYRHRKAIKGKCAVERENHEVIIPIKVSEEHVSGRVPFIYPNLSNNTEQVYGLTEYNRSKPRDKNGNGDLTKNFKSTHIAPKIEQVEYKIALRHAREYDDNAVLLWVDKVGTFRRIQCQER